MDYSKVCQLYPQFTTLTQKIERRQTNINVENDRRQGDRRQQSIPVENDRRNGYKAKIYNLDDKTKNDLKAVKGKVETFCRLVPPLRKLVSAYEESPFNKENNGHSNWLYSLGMLFRLINESEEDWHDLKVAIKGDNSMKEFQHPFWAFRGSLIDRKAEKFINSDIMLYDLKSVKKFLVKLGLTGIERQGDFVKFEGSYLAKVIARSTLRFPLLGAAFFSALESYNIAKAENKPKEALKAMIRIISIMGMSAICGAMGGYHGKKIELVSMGAGIILGSKLSEKINNQF